MSQHGYIDLVNIDTGNEWSIAWRLKAITWTNGDSSLASFCGIYPRGI